jgi:penicillin-binding protein 1A
MSETKAMSVPVINDGSGSVTSSSSTTTSTTPTSTTSSAATSSSAPSTNTNGNRAQEVYRAYLADLYSRAALPVSSSSSSSPSSTPSPSTSTTVSVAVPPTPAAAATTTTTGVDTSRATRIRETLEGAHHQLTKLLSRSMDDELRPQ